MVLGVVACLGPGYCPVVVVVDAKDVVVAAVLVADVVVESILKDSRVVMIDTVSCWAAVRSSVAAFIFARTVIRGSWLVFVVTGELVPTSRIEFISSMDLAALVLASPILAFRSVKEALMPETSKPADSAPDILASSFGLMAWNMLTRFEMLVTAARAIWVGVLVATTGVLVAVVEASIVSSTVVVVAVAVAVVVVVVVVEVVEVVEAVVVARKFAVRLVLAATAVLEPDKDKVALTGFRAMLSAARSAASASARVIEDVPELVSMISVVVGVLTASVETEARAGETAASAWTGPRAKATTEKTMEMMTENTNSVAKPSTESMDCAIFGFEDFDFIEDYFIDYSLPDFDPGPRNRN